MLSQEERKVRLAYWIRDTMFRQRLTAPKVAGKCGVSRSTVTNWAAGRQIPSMIYLGPLTEALSVDAQLFADLPEIPPSGAAAYLHEARESGAEEGIRRAHQPRVLRAVGKPAPSPGRHPRGTGAARE
jgi:transcriptional regulator with XRE-family HTH domain